MSEGPGYARGFRDLGLNLAGVVALVNGGRGLSQTNADDARRTAEAFSNGALDNSPATAPVVSLGSVATDTDYGTSTANVTWTPSEPGVYEWALDWVAGSLTGTPDAGSRVDVSVNEGSGTGPQDGGSVVVVASRTTTARGRCSGLTDAALDFTVTASVIETAPHGVTAEVDVALTVRKLIVT